VSLLVSKIKIHRKGVLRDMLGVIRIRKRRKLIES
jgi:hypothetical protein